MTKRCAIYTRKSSEEGLEQAFNSLHAQREACEAFIKSQKHEGWQVVKAAYDDGGISGGTMQRPALQQLLADIKNQRIDVVVVYKVDRLTRSLADFAKIVEIFDAMGISFVSVTQQFNTTSSMGRLTLNVLLSFAQFEREVTGERIRDKISASKKKGMWMGGYAPLGYDILDRKLIVNSVEAETIRIIYQRYLELGNVRLLQEALAQQNIRSKVRSGSIRPGGQLFSRGALYNLLANPMFIGQIRYKDTCYPGQHEGIVDHELWEQVQQKLADNRIGNKTKGRKSEACPLVDKLFDSSGERIVPVHANKKGRRYRYYVSQSLTAAPKNASSNGWRLPGQELEQVIANATLEILRDDNAITTALQDYGIAAHYIPTAIKDASNIQPIDVIDKFVQRVEVQQDGITLTLTPNPLVPTHPTNITMTRSVSMQMKRRGVEMRLVVGSGIARVDQALIKSIARAHKWYHDLISGRAHNMADIASKEGLDRSYVARVIDLAFLSPKIIESIMAGQQPAHLNIEKLAKQIDLPLDWSEQHCLLGFS